jgi:hypothetical protein
MTIGSDDTNDDVAAASVIVVYAALSAVSADVSERNSAGDTGPTTANLSVRLAI